MIETIKGSTGEGKGRERGKRGKWSGGWREGGIPGRAIMAGGTRSAGDTYRSLQTHTFTETQLHVSRHGKVRPKERCNFAQTSIHALLLHLLCSKNNNVLPCAPRPYRDREPAGVSLHFGASHLCLLRNRLRSRHAWNAESVTRRRCSETYTRCTLACSSSHALTGDSYEMAKDDDMLRGRRDGFLNPLCLLAPCRTRVSAAVSRRTRCESSSDFLNRI